MAKRSDIWNVPFGDSAAALELAAALAKKGELFEDELRVLGRAQYDPGDFFNLVEARGIKAKQNPSR